MYRQSEKLVKQQYLLRMSPDYGELDSLMAEIGWRVGGFGAPSKFQRVSRVGFVTAAMSLTGGQRWLASPGLVYYIYILGAFSPNGTLPGANFTFRPSLAFSYMDRKEGGGLLCPFRGELGLGPHLTKCGLGPDLLPYQVAFDPSSRLTATDMGQKLGAVPL